MRQSVPLRKPEDDQRESQAASERSRQSIDEWLAAAVAEQTRRSEARKGQTADAAPARPGSEREAPAPSPVAQAIEPEANSQASPVERTVLDTAAKTAAALGSVASWIERAQEQLAETTRASRAAEQRTTAVVTDAIGAIGERLTEIERKVETGASRPPFDALRSVERLDSGRAGGHYGQDDDAVRTLEDRIRDIADKLETSRPIGRRGLSPKEEVDAAVAEIRSRQSDLDTSGGREPAREAAPVRPAVDLAVQLREEIGRLSRRAGETAAPADGSFDRLREAVEGLQGSMAGLAKRDDVEAIERSLAGLSDRIPTLSGWENAGSRPDDDAARFAGEQFARLTRDVDVLSHKLDIVSATGIDPGLIETMSREIAEIRSLLTAVATPADLAGIGDQLADLKHELARMSSRQVEAGDIHSLRIAVEDLRDGLNRGEPAFGDASAAQGVFQQAARTELQPVAAMLVTLIQKIDRIERHAGDPDTLVQIERQIAGLTSAMSETTARDPALGALHSAISDLANEVASWREGVADVAERAARSAVAATLNSWPSGTDARTASNERTAPPPAGSGENLEAVNARLEDVVRRIGGLDHRGSDRTLQQSDERSRAEPPEPHRPDQADRDAEETLRRLNDALRLDAPSPGSDHAEPTPGPEVLLEPGAERPRAAAQPLALSPEPGAEARDVKASFIAAARRAAQAAAADAEKGKSSRPAPLVASAGERGGAVSGRFRSVLDRFRRPLLVSAAALVVAIGGYRLVQDSGSEKRSTVAVGPARQTATAPIVVAPPAAPSTVVARVDAPEPQTTQSVPAPRDERASPPPSASPSAAQTAIAIEKPPEVPAAEPPRAPTPPQSPERPSSAQAASPASAGKTETAALPPTETQPRPTPPPKGTDPGVPAGLRQAAANGEPAALYELAARTMEGRGIARDPRAAVALFEKAAEKNLAPAQYRMGNAYEKGIGVTRDIETARQWYQRAADAGNTRAMHNLAVLLAEGAGGKPDYNAAINWFQRAAEQGVRDSQFNLAVLFARGLGTSQDLVKSYTWFAIAAGQGDEEAGRKREEVSARLTASDLARAKAGAERWRSAPPNAAANDVPVSPAWSADPSKKTGRDGRA